jgi:formylglycine-generating enzyme required for sulfatase activity
VLVSANLLQPPFPDPNGVLAQTNYGWEAQNFPGYSPFAVPLGAYPDQQSPWGLLDVSGGTSEWTEEIRSISTGQMARVFDGSSWNDLSSGVRDPVWLRSSTEPWISAYGHGFRIASVVPAPSSLMGILGCVVLVTQRRRQPGAIA